MLLKNGKWSLTTLLQGKRKVGSKWAFSIKNNSDGSNNRYKAKLVAKI